MLPEDTSKTSDVFPSLNSPILDRKKKVSFREEAEKVSRDFSSSAADLVVRSSDGVHFHVYSQILVEASAVFNDMIALGTAHAAAIKDAGRDSIPIVDVAEDSNTVDALLRFVYPMRNPQLVPATETVDEALDAIVQLLKAADKYQMDGVLWTLREILVHPEFLRKAPVRVYAIACMFGLDDEAKTASKHTLSVDVLRTPLFGELSHISARDYIRLVQLHQNRASSAVSILQSATPTCAGCSKEREGGPLWWSEFKERAANELRQKPNTQVIFSAPFLARCVMDAKGICTHCSLSYLSLATQARLEHMKERIDALPSVVEPLAQPPACV